MASILLIEDDAEVRTVIRRMLESKNHEVVEAQNGKVGLRLYRKNSTDLVVTDILMPDKEGIETIRELRRDFPEVKIIAISGGGMLGLERYLKLAKKMGAQRTLEKPFNGNELNEVVRELLSE